MSSGSPDSVAACAAEFSIFTSITRLHGTRIPGEAPNSVPLQAQCDPTGASGGPIEPWVLGDEAYLAVKAALALRQQWRPYLKAQVALLASHGTPLMRPLWFDFAQDEAALDVEDQFMFGESAQTPDSSDPTQA